MIHPSRLNKSLSIQYRMMSLHRETQLARQSIDALGKKINSLRAKMTERENEIAAEEQRLVEAIEQNDTDDVMLTKKSLHRQKLSHKMLIKTYNETVNELNQRGFEMAMPLPIE